MKTTKNYFGYLFLALTLVFSLGLTSCSDDDENIGSKEDLIGTWQFVHHEWMINEDGEKDSGYDNFSSWKMKITFEKDGTAELLKYSDYSSEPVDVYNWSYKGNKLHLKNENDLENSETYTITTLTPTQLIMEASYKDKEDGISYEYFEKYTLKKIND